jgi:hypothetical protein
VAAIRGWSGTVRIMLGFENQVGIKLRGVYGFSQPQFCHSDADFSPADDVYEYSAAHLLYFQSQAQLAPYIYEVVYRTRPDTRL